MPLLSSRCCRSRWWAVLLGVGLLAGAGYGLRVPLLTALAQWLNVATPPQRTDYALILNGDPNARPFVGAALVKAGLASQILLVPMQQAGTGGEHPYPASEDLMRAILLHEGVPADRIQVLPGRCSSTMDEAAAVGRFLNRAGNAEATLAVITSDFHTRRTRWTYRRVLGGRARQVRFIAAPTDGFHAANWWRVEDGFVTYILEYCKLGFYLVRYGPEAWIAGLLAALLLGGAWLHRGRWRCSGRREVRAAHV